MERKHLAITIPGRHVRVSLDGLIACLKVYEQHLVSQRDKERIRNQINQMIVDLVIRLYLEKDR